MTEVIKKNGSREDFSEAKLRRSIEAAAREAKVPELRISPLVNDAAREPLALAKGKLPLEARIIRNKVLSRLDATAPPVAEAWRAFDRKRA